MEGPSEAGARAHVFVADLSRPSLDATDHRHLERALRVRVGDVVTASDGAGQWRRCRLAMGGGLDPAGDVRSVPAPRLPLTVAFAPTKGERPEWAVQKLTELGVDRIVAFEAARSVVRWRGERAAGPVERLRRVAREAAMQSRRAWLPVVEDVATFAEVAAREGAVLADRGGPPPSLGVPLVLVGPEGGWDEEERSSVPATVGLGDHVLRSETAVVVAGVVLCGLRSGLVAPA